MSRMNRTLIWFLLLLKSLLKKYSYLLILCSVPVLVYAMHLVSKQDSGVMTIVLYQENEADEISSKVISELTTKDSVIWFEVVYDESEAIEAVVSGKAQAAWIFDENMTEKVDAYTSGKPLKKGLIRVVELEESPLLQLSREKLYGTLYPMLSYQIYENFMINQLVETELIDYESEKWAQIYESRNYEDDIFVFSFPESSDEQIDFEKVNYLITPLRGMLIMVVVLSSFAAQMYYRNDQLKGVFVWMPARVKYVISFGYQYAAMLPICIVVYLALLLSGLFTKTAVEVGAMVLFSLMMAVFSNIVRRITKTVRGLGAMIPVIIIIMVSLSQIFLEINFLRPVQMLLPTYYYINVVHNLSFFVKMLIYLLVAIIMDILSYQFIEKRGKR